MLFTVTPPRWVVGAPPKSFTLWIATWRLTVEVVAM